MVALLTEGVGRNLVVLCKHFMYLVALLTEGVGRNTIRGSGIKPGGMSPSLRRAWVEIGGRYRRPALCWVALLTEGVDKNRESLAPPEISWAG